MRRRVSLAALIAMLLVMLVPAASSAGHQYVADDTYVTWQRLEPAVNLIATESLAIVEAEGADRPGFLGGGTINGPVVCSDGIRHYRADSRFAPGFQLTAQIAPNLKSARASGTWAVHYGPTSPCPSSPVLTFRAAFTLQLAAVGHPTITRHDACVSREYRATGVATFDGNPVSVSGRITRTRCPHGFGA